MSINLYILERHNLIDQLLIVSLFYILLPFFDIVLKKIIKKNWLLEVLSLK